MENQLEKYGLIPENHVYITPSKMVKNIGDMELWQNSEAYHECLGFICTISDSIKNKINSIGSGNASEEVDKVCIILETIDKWIDDIPPINQPQRFGNQAYRQWYSKLKQDTAHLLQTMLPDHLHKSIPEISIYLIEGFGNSTRIDYGTGHELSFLMFLCALFKIGYLKTNDQVAIACKVFVRYLELVRKLQVTYNMEPAGSHGVWSLDDYQFVPFIWGSSQFIGNGKLEPTCFLNENIVNKYASEYMFLSCIQYINKVKTGPFAEHSNQLWSISAVSTWSKINSGLIKMYKAEVLAKFPLVQHIFFGSVFTLKPFVAPEATRPMTSFHALSKLPSKMNYCNLEAKVSSSEFVNMQSGSSLNKISCSAVTSQNDRESRDTGNFAFKSPSDFARISTDFKLSTDLSDDKKDVKLVDSKSNTLDSTTKD